MKNDDCVGGACLGMAPSARLCAAELSGATRSDFQRPVLTAINKTSVFYDGTVEPSAEAVGCNTVIEGPRRGSSGSSRWISLWSLTSLLRGAGCGTG